MACLFLFLPRRLCARSQFSPFSSLILITKMDTSRCCKSSQQDIKLDYPGLLLAEPCPVCGVLICFHNNLLQQLQAGLIKMSCISYQYFKNTVTIYFYF
jgi:hypothetical protein